MVTVRKSARLAKLASAKPESILPSQTLTLVKPIPSSIPSTLDAPSTIPQHSSKKKAKTGFELINAGTSSDASTERKATKATGLSSYGKQGRSKKEDVDANQRISESNTKTTKKRKPDVDASILDTREKGETSESPVKRRSRKTAKAYDVPSREADPSQKKPIADIPINCSDPCAVLPTEIWHKILSRLPLSQVAKTSVLSKAWLDGARNWPMWQQICEKNELGCPKLKYKSYMAIVCANSYFICDNCYSHSTGRGAYVRPSEIPLKVHVIVEEGQTQGEYKDGDKTEGDKASGSSNFALAGKDDQARQDQGSSQNTAAPADALHQNQGQVFDQAQNQDQGKALASQAHPQAQIFTDEQSQGQTDTYGQGQNRGHGHGQYQDQGRGQSRHMNQEREHEDENQKAAQDEDKDQGAVLEPLPNKAPNNDEGIDHDQCQSVKQDKGKGKATEKDERIMEDWNLCLNCRRVYYKNYPEPLDNNLQDLTGEPTTITKTRARESYHLSETDMDCLVCEEYPNPHYRYGPPMRLYDLDDVHREAIWVHGGWVGVRAVSSETAKKRRAAFKQRRAVTNPPRRPATKRTGKKQMKAQILTAKPMPKSITPATKHA
ncbi:hypothetical protein BGX28_005894 [Mortierella sp. GBA30]|nr:hypothetical protein BGX28_005894 [Mortierella sp. GBA30]